MYKNRYIFKCAISQVSTWVYTPEITMIKIVNVFITPQFRPFLHNRSILFLPIPIP